MGRTVQGQIDRKLKRTRCNLRDKKDYKVIKINTDLIEYVPTTLLKK